MNVTASKESWSESAQGLLKTAFEGPTTTLNRVLLQKSNEILPFSSTTAILDNGCGVGQVLGRIIDEYGADINPDTRLVASDLSEGMIEVVKHRKQEETSKGSRLWDKVETKIWNAEHLDEAADESFSHVTAGLLLFMIAEPQHALKEILRVLKPNGLFAMSSFKSTEWMDFIEEHLAIIRPGTKLGSIPQAWASVEAIERELENTGFTEVKAEEVQVWYEFDDANAMTRFNMNIIPSVKMVTADWKEEEVEAAIGLQIEELERRLPDGKGRFGGVALVGFGRK